MDRRSFVMNTAAATLAAAGKAHAANDRIQLGFVGVGGRGQWLARAFDQIGRKQGLCRVVAVCDIWEKRRREVAELYQCQGYVDYREVVNRADVDAVVVATPDHWHATVALAAMNRGKDVYVEKPMCHTLDEARRMMETGQRTQRIVQVGANGGSSNLNLKAKELVAQGMIGELIMCQGSAHRNSIKGEWNWKIWPETGPSAEGDKHIDWQRFLGPAPERPWEPDRYFNFRKWWDYSGGIATDLFYHALAPFNMMWNKPQFPATVTASGGVYAFPDREVPDTFHMLAEYEQGFSVVLTGSMANSFGTPTTFRGREGTILIDRHEGALQVIPERHIITNQYKSRFGDSDTLVPVEPTAEDAHLLNWLECVRSRRQPHLDVVAGACAQVGITMAVMAYRQRRALAFNPADWTAA
jgi:predicted dehydrogenase